MEVKQKKCEAETGTSIDGSPKDAVCVFQEGCNNCTPFSRLALLASRR